MSERRSGTQSIERALQVVRVLSTRDRFGWGLADLAARCGLSHATTHRILRGLVRERLVAQRPEDRRYVLGPLVFELGLSMTGHAAFQAACKAPVARLARRFGTLAILYLHSGSDFVCAARAGPSPYAMAFDVGTRAPLVTSAGGVAILVHLPPEEARLAEQEGLRQMEMLGAPAIRRLRRMIERSRALGYGLNLANMTKDVHAFALPIRDAQGAVFAALAISGPAGDFPATRTDEVVAALREEVALIEKESWRLARGPGRA